MNEQSLTFIKIGGSLITNKDQEFSLNKEALKLIVKEVKKALESQKKLILGHGSGSYAHVPAKKYQTQRGILNEESYQGIVEVAQAAAKLHQIMMQELLAVGVKALSFAPHAMMISSDHQMVEMYTESLEKALSLNLLPVVYGDQILDKEVGCTIFSTEKVLSNLALKFQKQGYKIEKMIQCGQTNGVYNQDGKTIPLITPDNFSKYEATIAGSEGVDVTGGMLHKVKQSLALAQQGINSLIIDGIEHGSLAKAVNGESVLGTRVESTR